jgi:hypothetical protein
MRWVIAGISVLILALVGIHLAAYWHGGWSEVYTVGVTTYGLLGTALAALYKWNQRFYFLAKKVRFWISGANTYWTASFRFEIDPKQCSPELLGVVADRLKLDQKVKVDVQKKDRMGMTLVLRKDFPIGLRFDLDEDSLFVSTDRELLVPANLADAYVKRLEKIADEIRSVVHPHGVVCDVNVGFGEGSKNPYYGFFIERVPPDLLENFQVRFVVDRDSDCRVTAETDSVSIRSTRLADLFKGISKIVSLSALPEGAPK